MIKIYENNLDQGEKKVVAALRINYSLEKPLIIEYSYRIYINKIQNNYETMINKEVIKKLVTLKEQKSKKTIQQVIGFRDCSSINIASIDESIKDCENNLEFLCGNQMILCQLPKRLSKTVGNVDGNKLGRLLVLEDGSQKLEVQGQFFHVDMGSKMKALHEIGSINLKHGSYTRFGMLNKKIIITPNMEHLYAQSIPST